MVKTKTKRIETNCDLDTINAFHVETYWPIKKETCYKTLFDTDCVNAHNIMEQIIIIQILRNLYE